ncbi:hypothetical protein Shel_05820 [Slackia heliotrinireducens DSM 20476]|uniref:Uncharacterized protein n=1 Tax=Slackia heliotrinireducens (strain ATCC 29202 / DSM 20476 / NCTC 11029 / RHS 1) TaxID=471855 RepID=C7N3Q0_SLAHD|nr:hypothetical protein Shel_05820 [Slackia heliotrinireducens DSM 20476]
MPTRGVPQLGQVPGPAGWADCAADVGAVELPHLVQNGWPSAMGAPQFVQNEFAMVAPGVSWLYVRSILTLTNAATANVNEYAASEALARQVSPPS